MYFCFTTIKNYTTLKRLVSLIPSCMRFTTIKNYTTLKRGVLRFLSEYRFTTIKNYTTLKHKCFIGRSPWYLLAIF